VFAIVQFDARGNSDHLFVIKNFRNFIHTSLKYTHTQNSTLLLFFGVATFMASSVFCQVTIAEVAPGT
jgi:hypothetical protein